MKYLLANAVSIVCIVAACVLVALGKDGWGWFLFVALICGVEFYEKK